MKKQHQRGYLFCTLSACHQASILASSSGSVSGVQVTCPSAFRVACPSAFCGCSPSHISSCCGPVIHSSHAQCRSAIVSSCRSRAVRGSHLLRCRGRVCVGKCRWHHRLACNAIKTKYIGGAVGYFRLRCSFRHSLCSILFTGTMHPVPHAHHSVCDTRRLCCCQNTLRTRCAKRCSRKH